VGIPAAIAAKPVVHSSKALPCTKRSPLASRPACAMFHAQVVVSNEICPNGNFFAMFTFAHEQARLQTER
jgi:hypothetical protein